MWRSLQNGIILCKLFEIIWPNSIKNINPANSKAWKFRENISSFLDACIKVAGLKYTEIFSISDLFEKKSMPKVLGTLQTLSYVAAEKIGVSWPDPEDSSEFSSQ